MEVDPCPTDRPLHQEGRPSQVVDLDLVVRKVAYPVVGFHVDQMAWGRQEMVVGIRIDREDQVDLGQSLAVGLPVRLELLSFGVSEV